MTDAAEASAVRPGPWRKVRKFALRVLVMVVVGYALMVGLLAGCQSRLVYHPSNEQYQTPDDAGLTFEDVHLETDDGVKIHGWWTPARKPRGTALFFHGNAGNITHRVETLAILNRLRLNTLIIDYRGYGTSEGSPSEEGTYKDAEAAWDYLTKTRGIPAEHIVIHGRSLGGGVAVYLAEEHTPAALIAESTFTSIPDVAARMFPFLPVRWVCRIKYNSAERIAHVKCPVLVVHSPADEVIHYDFGKKLYAAAGQPKQFLEISGGHNDSRASQQRYTTALDIFLAAHLPPDRNP